MSDHVAFRASVAADPDDPRPVLVYADWFDDRDDPRGRLLRVWVDLSWHASHMAVGFRGLLAEYRRLWSASDLAWRRAFAEARPWVDARLAEELCRAYLWHVEKRSQGQCCTAVAASWFPEAGESHQAGWLVPYWPHPHDPQWRHMRWVRFVQPDLGWVYGVPTCGPMGLRGFDLASGERAAF